ncbi:MAG: zinc metallopeptidase, partial [Firmicutes bacterium]|nr:zinc metallopeptidase [Bacillota bacterium]
VPAANIGSKLSWPLILVGLAMGMTGLARIGVFLFTFVVLFQLITLPVEFNASARALDILDSQGILYSHELPGAKRVLSAAAFTYVAALITAILTMVRLIIMALSFRRNRW